MTCSYLDLRPMISLMRQLLVIVALIASSPAFGVETSQCPNTIRLGYEQLIPVSQKHLDRILKSASPETRDLVIKARATIIESAREIYNSLEYKFDKRQSGECLYRTENGRPGKALIFTRGKEDYLRVILPFENVDIFATHMLEDFGPDGIEAEYYAAHEIHVRSGNTAYKIGWAYNLEVKFSANSSAPIPESAE